MSNFWKDLGFKTKIFLQLALAVASIFFIFYLIPKVNSVDFSYEKNKPWQYKDLYSPYDFAVIKPADFIEQEKNKITTNFKKHYVRNEVDNQVISKFSKLFSSRILQLDSLNYIRLNKEKYLKKGSKILEEIHSKGIISIEEKADINIVLNNNATLHSSAEFYTITEAKDQIEKQEFESLEIRNFLVPLLKMSITENIVYDKTLSNTLLQNQLAEISSTKGMVKKDEKIISKGEIVDLDRFQKLESYKKKHSEQILDKSNHRFMSIGYFFLISILIGILILYLYNYKKDIFVHFRQFSLIFLLINVSVFLASIFSKTDVIYIYILPFAIVPIVLRAFFEREVAAYVHFIVILISALFIPKAFSFLFLQFVAGFIAIYGNKDVTYWSQFFKSIGFIFVAYLVSFVGLSLAEAGNYKSIDISIIGFLALNSIFSFLAYPLIVFFEKIFGLLSDISLVEYTDINKPLLKRLSLEAPGTFQHSLQVSNLAEAAATEIEANSLLVKVGALYHDIGKMQQSIYFIENQFPDENPHSKLNYEESAKIIIAHVTDGIKLAKKNGIPEQIIDFIRTHHGTTRVEYFYRMHAKVHPDEEINEKTFKYPGPAPFKKEHAILMMADSVEAASRSLKNPSHETLNNLVDSIIEYQQKRRQFDNVDITFQEITKCKEVFKKMLASVYHIRIEYPDAD